MTNIFKSKKAEPVLFMLYFMIMQVVGAGIVSLLGVKDEIQVLALGTLVSTILTVALFWVCRWWKAGKEWHAAMECKPVIYCLVSVVALSLLIPSVWLQELMPELPNVVEAEFEGLMHSWLGFLAITICAPIGEEVVFRGGILRSLLGQCDNKWVAIVLSAFLFSLAHFNPAQLPHTFLTGLLLGWIYMRSGSILLTVLYHWVNNTMAFIAGYYYGEDAELVDMLGGHLNVVAALFVSTVLLTESLRYLKKIWK